MKINQSITILYFSPTNNTKVALETLADAISPHWNALDLTCDPAPSPQSFGEDSLVILGAPVYGGRIPHVAVQRFSEFRGNNTPCILVATYGNRHYDDALVELSDLAENQGFVVVGAAALIGRHTYGEIQLDRPNEEDLTAIRDFAKRILEKPELLKMTDTISGDRPYRDGGSGGRFRPLTTEACIQCGLCVAKCPVSAISNDCVTLSDSCLACFRCIRNCPVGAKNMDTKEYQEFVKMFNEKLKEPRENTFFL